MNEQLLKTSGMLMIKLKLRIKLRKNLRGGGIHSPPPLLVRLSELVTNWRKFHI